MSIGLVVNSDGGLFPVEASRRAVIMTYENFE